MANNERYGIIKYEVVNERHRFSQITIASFQK